MAGRRGCFDSCGVAEGGHLPWEWIRRGFARGFIIRYLCGVACFAAREMEAGASAGRYPRVHIVYTVPSGLLREGMSGGRK
jgi:hypothetical protein